MYIYNITINIDDASHKEWLQWIEIYITEILNTQKFTSAKMTEVMMQGEKGRTYSIQFTTNTKEELLSYQQNHENDFRLKAYHKFGDKMMSFATELKLVKEFFAANLKN